MYDVVIVGAGPAGMFAAYELSDTMKVAIIDMGEESKNRECSMIYQIRCTQCEPCRVLCGVGGAGIFSDGILNLRPDIGGDLASQVGSWEEAWDLVDYVDKIYLKFGAPDKLCKGDEKEIEKLRRKASSVGAKFIDIVQRHIGSDNSPYVIEKFENYLREKGVKFILNTKVNDLIIKNGKCKGVICEKGRINSKYVILAPGRSGAEWISSLIVKHGIDAKYGPIDVGVRVEVPAIVMDPVTSVNRDPKFHITTRRYDDFVRTFCCNERGFVVKEQYGDFIVTNGHSFTKMKSENTNFAFLVRINLTEPVENTTKYGLSVAKLATTIGGGKPILQRMGDLIRGRRSTEWRIKKSFVVPTLKDVTPGDISMALPHRVVMDIIEGLEILDKIVPGVSADSTLLYAPEVKFYSMQLKVNNKLRTNIENLYVAGDGAGLSRDIINASATGVISARGILSEEE